MKNITKVGLYARVSTVDQQTLPMQIQALKKYAQQREWKVAMQIEETGSGASDRPQRDLLLKAARQREIDNIIVWRLDRWGRSRTDLLNTLEELSALKVGFISITEALDLTTATGKAMAGLLAIFAQFERDLLRERVKAGIAHAKKLGKPHGRPKTVTLKQDAVKKLFNNGYSQSKIAKELQIGRGSVQRLLSLPNKPDESNKIIITEDTSANTTKKITLLKPDTQQKIFALANKAGISQDEVLNILTSDEIERNRLLKISDELDKEGSKETAPSQKITKICKKHLLVLDHESESYAIRKTIENLYTDLLRQKIISVNTKKGCIVESQRLKTSRTNYYWYAGVLAKRIAMWFGTLDIYLWHELLHPLSEVVFIGMPTNVEICYQVFLHLYQLFKKAKASYKKDAGNWGSKRDMEEEVNHYMSKFAQELDHTQAYIENNDCNKLLYNYADKKFAYAMRD